MTTVVTLLDTWLHGERVGEDAFGNRYYQDRRPPPPGGRRRRWVVYKGEAEASKVPPLWHAWLHHVIDEPPVDGAVEHKPWEKPHVPNLTGTPFAYRPPGDLAAAERAEDAPSPYRPWRPRGQDA